MHTARKILHIAVKLTTHCSDMWCDAPPRAPTKGRKLAREMVDMRAKACSTQSLCSHTERAARCLLLLVISASPTRAASGPQFDALQHLIVADRARHVAAGINKRGSRVGVDQRLLILCELQSRPPGCCSLAQLFEKCKCPNVRHRPCLCGGQVPLVSPCPLPQCNTLR